ncbi:MAG: hypothetical protein R2783_04055 [Gelidibacter sp.]
MEEATMKKSVLFISCEEAYEICDKSQYGEATLLERLKLNLRYIWCRFTQAYVKRNRKLTQTIKASQVQSLHPSEREQLLEKFKQQLNNSM